MRPWACRGLGLHCVGYRLVDGMQVEKSPPPHREGRAGPNIKALGYWVWELTGDVGDLPSEVTRSLCPAAGGLEPEEGWFSLGLRKAAFLFL